MGYNVDGQLGTGDRIDGLADDVLTPVLLASPTNVVHAAAGGEHTMLLDGDGRVWATGDNGGGQLGLGDRTRRAAPEQLTSPTDVVEVSTGHSHTMMVAAA